ANGATLGGHCEVGDNVNIGGLTAVHQFVRIGDNAFLGGCSAVVGDVIPYAIAMGNRASLRGLNIVGLKRSGFPRAEIHQLRRAYRMIFDRSRTVAENVELARVEFSESPAARKLIDVTSGRGTRHFTVPALESEPDEHGDDGDRCRSSSPDWVEGRYRRRRGQATRRGRGQAQEPRPRSLSR